MKEWDFSNAACDDYVSHDESAETVPGEGHDDGKKKKKERMNRSEFREAINRVRTSLYDADGNDKQSEDAASTGKIRNVEMLTLGTNAAGLPIKKNFDWAIGSVRLDEENGSDYGGGDGDIPSSVVILYGDMINEVESSDRARDAELIDFFQNAPIAMHWLNGDGNILWANQTELNVLGYAPEEYIGQNVMNFCPDEKELVLEIFKQLGSGNSIADVPVRFRTKDGKMVHLLIDSNVAYNPDGSFGHTRCFIRDDTARKIRDARTQLMVVENERSLRMLDGFLSRTLHHIMSPLTALRGVCEVVSDRLQPGNGVADTEDEREKNCDLLDRAAETVTTTTRMVADCSDLARFDEGATLKTKIESVDLRGVGLEAIENLRFNNLRLSGGDDGISVSLSLVGAGGRGAMDTDKAVLLRVLAHILENAVREVSTGGRVTLQITSLAQSPGNDRAGSVVVEILDDGKGLPEGTCLDQGDDVMGPAAPSPAPCHRYRIGNKRGLSDDPEDMRRRQEEGLRDLKQNGIGVGLPLSYHLVRMLGGDLRAEKLSKGTRIWFALPNTLEEKADMSALFRTETLLKKGLPPGQITFTSEPDNKRRRINEDTKLGNFVVSDSGSTTSGDETASVKTASATIAEEPAPKAVAKCGIKASMPFSVLIVEDTDICARLLAMQLKKLKCSTQRAVNGRVAVDLLKESLPGTFDLILMDLRMPVMDGLEATRIIRNELEIRDLPVLALTGEMREDVRSECEGIGFTEFFQKPLPRKKLQEIVAKYKAARDS